MKRLLTWLSRRRFPYTPLITVVIHKDRLIHNLNEFRKITPHGKIAPVLKSNAYGHGLIEVARIFEKEKTQVPFLIVDSYFEALALRAARIHTPLLIIGYTQPQTILKSKLRSIAFTITTLENLKAIRVSSHHISIHLKIDTGMHRQGIMPEEINEGITLIKNSPKIRLEGICTHLADADGIDTTYTHSQITTWNYIVHQFKKEFPLIKWIHASATYGHSFSKEIEANISRLGIGLYGLSTQLSRVPNLEIKPVLEMKTIITDIKSIKKGGHVGYNNAFTATDNMLIATIPVGYYEGIDRRLSNNGYILVGLDRIPCPIIGRVSMNITCIDVSHIPNIKTGDEAIVISATATDPNSIASIVKKSAGTIPYELVIKIPAHLKRVVLT